MTIKFIKHKDGTVLKYNLNTQLPKTGQQNIYFHYRFHVFKLLLHIHTFTGIYFLFSMTISILFLLSVLIGMKGLRSS